MLGALFTSVPGALDRRFLLSALLPSFAFCGAGLTLVTGTRWGLSDATREWSRQPDALMWLQLAAFLIVVLLVAQGLAGLRISMLRLFEGYWSPAAARLIAAYGVRWHRHQLDLLGERVTRGGDRAAYQQIYLRYPPHTRPGQVMPTRLGNILKAGETYATLRYGIDGALVWPRLYQVLPERLLATLAGARSDLDAMLAVSALSGLFALSSAGYLLATTAPWPLYLLCLWAGAGLSWLAYRTALTSAITYSQQVRAAFDLYRTTLLEHLGEEPAPDLAMERAHWARLCGFWYRGIPPRRVEPSRASEWPPFPTPPPAPAPPGEPARGHVASPVPLPLSGWFGLIVGAAGVVGALILGLL